MDVCLDSENVDQTQAASKLLFFGHATPDGKFSFVKDFVGILEVMQGVLGDDNLEALRSLCTGRLQLIAPSASLIPFSDLIPHGSVTSYQTSETGSGICRNEQPKRLLRTNCE